MPPDPQHMFEHDARLACRLQSLRENHEIESIVGIVFQVGIGVTIKDNTMYVTEIFVQRGSSYSAPTTTTRRTTTTTRRTTTATHTYRPVASVTHTVQHALAAPKSKPAPVVAIPQNVDLLVRMVGMDSDHVDPATGAAAGF